MKKTNTVLEDLCLLLKKDFKYDGIEYDYDTSHRCDTNCDSYCRCGTIEKFRINTIDLKTITSSFHRLIDDEFTKYCIERSLYSHKLWDNSVWEHQVQRGYYGEEIGSITIDYCLQKSLAKMFSEIIDAKTNKEKLFIVLNKEYGYILPELDSERDFSIVSVDPKNIKTGNHLYYRRLENDVIEQYKDRVLPIGVGIYEGGDYIRLLDGYHRFAANNLKKEVKIIVGV